MRKLFLCLFLTSQAYAAGGVQSALTVSSGTFQSVDMYGNADGSNRQAIVIGDFSSSDTARVDQVTGLRVSLSTSALTTSTALKVDGSAVTQPVSGTFWQATQPVSVATPYGVILTTSGANASTATVVVSGTPNVSVSNTPSVSQSGTWIVQIGNTQNSTSVQVISTSTLVQGTAAAGAATSGNPIQNGVLASSNTPTFQTDTGSGVMSPMRGTRSGAVVTVLDCPREQIVKSSITITASTTETVILSSGAASVYNDLLELLALNTSATATRVDIRSGGGPTGTTIDFGLYIPAGETRGFTTPHPWPQTLSASNWTAQSSASVTDVRIYGIFCKSK